MRENSLYNKMRGFAKNINAPTRQIAAPRSVSSLAASAYNYFQNFAVRPHELVENGRLRSASWDSRAVRNRRGIENSRGIESAHLYRRCVPRPARRGRPQVPACRDGDRVGVRQSR